MSYVADLDSGLLAMALNASPEQLVEQELAKVKASPFQGKIVVLTERGIWLYSRVKPLVDKISSYEIFEDEFED